MRAHHYCREIFGLAGFALLFAVGYALWDRRHRDQRELAESREHPNRMRQRLIDRVIEFAQSQFDGGLYRKARKEFHLAERPMQVTTREDRRSIPACAIEQPRPGRPVGDPWN